LEALQAARRDADSRMLMPRETVISGLHSAIPAADCLTAAAENKVTSARPASNSALEATPISHASERARDD